MKRSARLRQLLERVRPLSTYHLECAVDDLGGLTSESKIDANTPRTERLQLTVQRFQHRAVLEFQERPYGRSGNQQLTFDPQITIRAEVGTQPPPAAQICQRSGTHSTAHPQCHAVSEVRIVASE